jgi:gliding motility-associated-like protein
MKNFICIIFTFVLFSSSLFAQVSISATTQISTCSANGVISLTINGGVPPYNIMLDGVVKASTPNTSYTLAGVSTGNYQLQVMDNGGILSNAIIAAVGGDYLEPTVTGVYANCQITATAHNGKAPFQYAISYTGANGPFTTFQSSNVFTNVPAGNSAYLRVKDACDNIYTAALSIYFPNVSFGVECTPIDSVKYHLQVSVISGNPPYTYTCVTSGNGTQTNIFGTFTNQTGCQYTITVTDNCGHSHTMQGQSCFHPTLHLGCMDCAAGTLQVSATGGKAPYHFIASDGNGNTFSNNTGVFAGLGEPINGLYYKCTVQDACGSLGEKYFYCLDAAIKCENATGFNGQVDFTISNAYLNNNPQYPIELNCAGCTPSNVIINSAAQLPVHFDGLMSDFQQISVMDNCDNVYNAVSGCGIDYTINMTYTSSGGGSGGGGGGGGNGGPPGSGQAQDCGNTLVITNQTAGMSYELYTLPTATFYATNTTGVFPFIPPAVYQIRFISPTGHLIKIDTFDTSIFFSDFTKDCRTLLMGACPTGLIFALHDANGNPVELGNTSGIFTNLQPGALYQVFAKDTISLKSISKWVRMDSIGTLKYEIVNCQDLQAHLTLPQNAKGDTVEVYTLTSLNGTYNQQNLTGFFPQLVNGTYTLMVTRGNCDTLTHNFTIGGTFQADFCLSLQKNSAGKYAWAIQTNPLPGTHYLLFDKNGDIVPSAVPDIYHYLAPGDYTFASGDCAMYSFKLPNFPDTLLTAEITSYCSNLACIQAGGAMGYNDWQQYEFANNIQLCWYPLDIYEVYRNGTLIITSTGSTFCHLASGGNYSVALVRFGNTIDSINLYVSPYKQPNLAGTTGFVCTGATTADIELQVDGNGIPFTFILLNPPLGYTPTQIVSNSPNVTFPNLPIGLYDFMVYDDCGSSSDFSSRVTELAFSPSWVRYCDGTIQLFAPNYSNWEYSWTDANGAVVGTTYNPLIINLNAATYTITVHVAGCSFTTTVDVPAQNNVPTGIITDAGPDQEVPYSYLATAASAYLQGNAPEPNESVLWTQALPMPSLATIATPMKANTIITVSAAGVYTFVYKVFHAPCIGVDTVRIHFFDCGKYEIELEATAEGCKGATKDGTATVFVTGGTGPYTYTWSTGEIGQTCHNLTTSDYTVVVNDESGCILNHPQSSTIPIHVPFISSKVRAGFSSLPKNEFPILQERNTIQFLNNSVNATAFSWVFDHFGTSTDINPIYTLTDTGLWKVTLYAENEYCFDEYSLLYHIIPNGTIFIATAFTPNGDGHNDTFSPIGAHVVEVEFTIYDRWGKLIFESQNMDITWDGTSEGKSAPEGVYTFVLHALLESGVKVNHAGTVTLVR